MMSRISSFTRLSICLSVLLPEEIILPRPFREDDPHSASFLSFPLPLASWSMPSSRRRAFFGERNR